jgi:hypothetical protein
MFVTRRSKNSLFFVIDSKLVGQAKYPSIWL